MASIVDKASAAASKVVANVRDSLKNRDPYVWLEDVEGTKSLEWVKERNNDLPFDGTGPVFDKIKSALDAKDKIPYVYDKINNQVYNFWRDEDHERGIWRTTSFESYCTDEPDWSVVLDLDELCKKDGIKYVWHGFTYPQMNDGKTVDRCLIQLSPGGGDSVIIREFDLLEKCFFRDEEQPFNLPEAKQHLLYKDLDTLLVATDFGSGSMTDSGYARQVKEWKRGTPLSEAKLVFQCKQTDMMVDAQYVRERGGVEYELGNLRIDFYSFRKLVSFVKGITRPDGTEVEITTIKEIDFPLDSLFTTFGDQFIFENRSKYLDFDTGSVLAVPAYKVLDATPEAPLVASDFVVLFKPSPRVAMEKRGMTKTKSHLVLQLMDNVKSRLSIWHYSDGTWTQRKSNFGSEICTMHTWTLDGMESEEFLCSVESFIQPVTLSIRNAAHPDENSVIKQEKARFDASDVEMHQFEAESLDGTKVPYFQISKRLEKPATRPTLLWGYGGFEIPILASYQVTTGLGWLEEGHVFVCANIRGGGEFPGWHVAALKEKRHKAYEDFEAIAKDLIDRKVTTPKQLACSGRSNGGLLAGNMLTRRSKLFGAIIIGVPLLDMKRYSKLLAGASWMGEYGDPDTKDWEFLKQYSPYHNLDASRPEDYPPTFFFSSTRDDRVHPGHARKMVAKLLAMGVKDCHYWENIEGGHGGAATNEQTAKMWGLQFQFLTKYLC